MEQERPNGNHKEAAVAAMRQGKTGEAMRERLLGVGLSHSSEENCKGSSYARAVGAKGRAEQGTFWRER